MFQVYEFFQVELFCCLQIFLETYRIYMNYQVCMSDLIYFYPMIQFIPYQHIIYNFFISYLNFDTLASPFSFKTLVQENLSLIS